MEQKPNSNTDADVTTSSSHNAKPLVGGSALSRFPKLSKCQAEILDKLIWGYEIQVDYTDVRHTEYSLVSDGGDVERLSIGTFLFLKRHNLIRHKYSPALDIERWS